MSLCRGVSIRTHFAVAISLKRRKDRNTASLTEAMVYPRYSHVQLTSTVVPGAESLLLRSHGREADTNQDAQEVQVVYTRVSSRLVQIRAVATLTSQCQGHGKQFNECRSTAGACRYRLVEGTVEGMSGVLVQHDPSNLCPTQTRLAKDWQDGSSNFASLCLTTVLQCINTYTRQL
jgi:hypothetical protein